jgi:protein ImuB
VRLWIGVHLHCLALEVYRQRWAEDLGCVVLGDDRVVAASPSAMRGGARMGMRRGGVLMLLPQALLFEKSETLERDALEAVATALLQYTPQVTLSEESTVLIDIGQSLTLFGGIHALCKRVRQTVRTLGFTAIVSCAPTARGAWLLARAGAGRTLKMPSLARKVDRLPVGLIPPARAFLSWFEGIGCETLADLRRLPRPGLQRRCGNALLALLDAAHGDAPELFDWVVVPETFHARIELFARIENAELLLAGARGLLEQLAGWLTSRQLSVLGVTLLLEHERGRVAMPPTAIDVTLAEPTWSDEHLVRLLKERLGRVELPAPVIELALRAAKTEPMAPPNESLFPEPGGSAQDQVRMLEVLVARLGTENVLQASPKADYRPEEANNWVPFDAGATAPASASLPVTELPLRPAWLLAKPIALLMRNHRPFYGSPLKIVTGPERIEAGWWTGLQARDYYVAEGEDHALYWIYRERMSVAGDQVEYKWFLHGLFA